MKIRGYRIELGEIESVLNQHAAVRESVVIADAGFSSEQSESGNRKAKIENPQSERRLVAYVVVNDPAPSINDLRNFLKAKLPEYMIPSAFVFLESLPLTPNGKVDRKALPVPDQARPELEAIFVRPRNPVEEMLAEIWAEVLKVERIGIHDNFFDLGGHSLLATQVVSRMRRALQVEIPLRALFETPTVAGLAERIGEIHQQGTGTANSPHPSGFKGQGSPAFFCPAAVMVFRSVGAGEYGLQCSRRCPYQRIRSMSQHWSRASMKLSDGTRALRTTFSTVDGEPVQIIASSLSLSLPVVDLSDQAESEREEASAAAGAGGGSAAL